MNIDDQLTIHRIEDGNPKLSKGDTSSALRSTSEDVISQISTKNLEEIISQTIRKVQEEFMQEPGANIGAFLRLEGVEFDKLWATNLTSARKLQGMNEYQIILDIISLTFLYYSDGP
jgi:hypothetical protein